MNPTPQAPYFGTFDPAKHYHKVLFKPGFPVQARELNDIQAQAQHQIGSFADHIFKNGSRVSNARSTITRASYIRCQALTPTSSPVDFSQVKEGMVVKGIASGVEGSVVASTEAGNGDPATLFVQYNKVGIDGVQAMVIPGEDLVVSTSAGVEVCQAIVKCPSCPGAEVGEIYPTGKSIFFFIDEGIFYYNHSFVDVDRQVKILSKYAFPDQNVGTVGLTAFAGLKVGLDYIEDFVTVSEDSGLADNALGYPNEANAGADRLRVKLVVAVRGYTSEEGKNYILLAKIDPEGRTEYIKSDAEYSAIMDAIAKRTYETNGNYTVRPFGLSFYNHRKSSIADATGWLTNGDADKLVALCSPSVGYVQGYRTETLVDSPVVFPKARDTKRVVGSIMQFSERAYVVMKPGAVIWPNPIADNGLISTTRVSLFDAVNATGAQIGSMLVYNIALDSGTPGTNTANYRYYFNDLTLTAGKTINDVKSAAVTTSGFIAEPVLDASNRFTIANPLNTDLVFKLPYNDVKTLKSTNPANPGTMILTVRKKYRATLSASGGATFTASSNQSFGAVSPSTVAVTTTPGNVSTAFAITGANTSATATTITVSAGSAFAGHTLTLFLDVLLTNQTQNNKTFETGTFVTTAQPPHLAGQAVALGIIDCFKIVSAKIFDHTTATPVEISDVTEDWTLDSGITEYGYGESKVVKKTSSATPFLSTQRLHISYQAFGHSGSTGFYTVDSYGQMLVPDTNGFTALTYETIPGFTNKNKVSYALSASIDFRPSLLAGSTMEVAIPAPGSTAIYEIEYYLGRADLLQLRKDGTLYMKQGLPSDSPTPPKADEDAMALYQVWLRPYTYSLQDVSFKFIENKRYTMRDIGRLDDRIGKVEYYTLLSLLETNTAALTTKDAQGLDRYKNGFLVDDFSGFKASDLNHPEFHAALDRTRREMRPSFKSRNNKLIPNKTASVGVKWIGPMAIREYEDEVADVQPYATKHISINPYFQVSQEGRVAMEPNIDTWSDDKILPPVITDIDAGVEALRSVANAAGVLGTDWGSWQLQNRTIVGQTSNLSTTAQTNSFTQNRVSGGWWGWQNVDTIRTDVTTVNTNLDVTTSTRNDFQRTGVDRSIGSRTQSYSSGESVRSVQVIPYMRALTVRFFATKLKPNTRVYAYFDTEPVGQFCRNIGVTVNSTNLTSTKASLQLGSALFTNADGELVGEFQIPAGRFFTGQKRFRLTADVNYAATKTGGGDVDAETTWAEGIFFSGGLDVTKQENRQNVITPTFSSRQVSEGRSEITQNTENFSWQTTNESSQLIQSISIPPPPPAIEPPPLQPPLNLPVDVWNNSWNDRSDGGDGGGGDPVAQSFIFPGDRFITGFDVYFAQVDMRNVNTWAEIRTMINGYPSSQALGRVDFLSTDIIVSEDASIPYHIKFELPIFCQAKTEYCFVVGGWSPETRIWVAKMGGKDVAEPTKTVETQPALGSSFRSQNGTTWNAEQFEDIKYRIQVAKFTSSQFKVVVENSKQAAEYLEENPLETQTGSSRVRVFHRAHGYVEGDKVDLDVALDLDIEVTATAGTVPPTPGQIITTATASAKVVSIINLPTPDLYRVKLEKIVGRFATGQAYTTLPFVPFSQNYLLDALDFKTRQASTVLGGTGAVSNGSHTDLFPGNAINGIPVEALHKQHTISLVDSANSYIIDAGTPAGASMRAGGIRCAIRDASLHYEVINFAGSVIPYSSGEAWTFTGIGHGRSDTQFSGDNYRQLTPIEFAMGNDVHLAQPFKLAGTTGEAVNAVKSIVVTGEFTDFPSNYVSPVVNTDAFSATVITSDIDYETAGAMNVIPNASNRFVAETDPVNGSSPYKYVSVAVQLKDPALDLRLLVDAYKDVNAEFDLYVKTLGVSDTATLDSKPWRKVTLPTDLHSVDLQDFREYDALCSTAVASWTNEPFSTYRVKIVGRSKNPCKPPIFKNLRTIAVT